jgi:hypothetical protein
MVSDMGFAIPTVINSSFQGLDDVHPVSNACGSVMIMIFIIRVFRVHVFAEWEGGRKILRWQEAV